MTAATN